MTGPERAEFDRKIPAFLMRQRWFGGKARTIDTASVRTWVAIPDCDGVLLLVDVHYSDGLPDTYALPLVRMDPDRVQAISEKHPEAVFAPCRDGQGAICDATFDDRFCQWLLAAIERDERVDFSTGFLRATAGQFYPELRGDKSVPLAAQRSSAEQSNTSIVYGSHLILKLFRHIEVGANPDCEMTRYLGEQRGLKNIPKFGGMIFFQSDGGELATLGMLQEMVDNQGDGWAWTMEELARYFENLRRVPGDARSLLATSQRSLVRWPIRDFPPRPPTPSDSISTPPPIWPAVPPRCTSRSPPTPTTRLRAATAGRQGPWRICPSGCGAGGRGDPRAQVGARALARRHRRPGWLGARAHGVHCLPISMDSKICSQSNCSRPAFMATSTSARSCGSRTTSFCWISRVNRRVRWRATRDALAAQGCGRHAALLQLCRPRGLHGPRRAAPPVRRVA
jgi:hypothetical protein